MARKAARDRKTIPPSQLNEELRSRMAEINAIYNDVRELTDTVHIPHTVLPSLQSTYRFLQFAGDHIQAAITLNEAKR